MKEVKKQKSSENHIDFVKWFSELNKDSISVAGGKGANLAEIFNLKIPVPPGFVVTAQAYDYFIKKSKIDVKIKELLETIDYEDTEKLNKVTKEIREIIEKSTYPREMEEEILESYENLDDRDIKSVHVKTAHDILRTAAEPIFVAVRSSATTEDLADASFAGQQESFVNVKGKTQLLEHIKKAFSSLFTARATYYRNKKGFKHEQASLAVVVQKMVDSDKSGVIFSKDPSERNDNVVMEAIFGLGEGIVSGTITPDKYEVSPDLKILSKEISNKKIAITRDSGGNKEIVKLREEKSKSQVLKEHEIKKLADFSLKLEEHFKKPQDIEFAIENDEIYIVQTRPITTLGKKAEPVKQLKGEIILKGIAASPGIGSGKIRIIHNLNDLSKIQKGDILVTEMTNPDMVVSMQKCTAIVTDEGGMTAHAAIVSREMGIPAVVGTQEATTKLKEGEIITVDGFSGNVYKGKTSETVQKEIHPVTSETKTEIKVIVDLPSFAKRAAETKLKKVGLTRIEGIIAESGKHPNYFLKKGEIKDYQEIIFKGISQISKHFEEMWVRTSDIRSDEFENLEGAPKEKEANPMLGNHGIRFGIKNPKILEAELRALKKVSETDKKIGLLLPQVISVEELRTVKNLLIALNFKQAKLGIMIETPAAVQLIRELCDEGIDFISIGSNDLTQYMLAVDRGNEQVQDLYDEMHPAVLYQLEYVIRVCKRNKVETSICGQAGSRKEMVKFLVEKGIDSITVNADMASEIANYVSEIEKSIIKDTDKEPRKYQPKPNEPKEDFLKPQDSKFVQEDVLQEIKNNIEEGLDSFENPLKDKRGEIPVIPGVEKLKSQEISEPEETKQEIIEELEKSGVPENIAKKEEEIAEEALEEFDDEPEAHYQDEEDLDEEFDDEPEFKPAKDEVLDIF